MTAKSFKDSQEAHFRRVVRDAIRKADLTKSERDVLLALTNMWMHHKGGRGEVHPGREKLAHRAGVTTKTVSRCLSKFRDAGVLSVVSNLKGGWGKATRYEVNLVSLFQFCGRSFPEFVPGYLVEQNVPHSHPKMSHNMRDKMSHGYNNNVLPFPSQRLNSSFEPPVFHVIGGAA